MSQTVKQSEITRVCKAVLNAGLEVSRVEVDPATGKIHVITDSHEVEIDNEWDE